MGLVIGWDWETVGCWGGGERWAWGWPWVLGMGPACGIWVLAGQRWGGRESGYIPGGLSPPVRDWGSAGWTPPLGPCPFCAPSPKALYLSPRVSMETRVPSPYPRLRDLLGALCRSEGYGEGTCRPPRLPWPHPLLSPPSSQHQGDLPGALAAQQAEEQSAAPGRQHAEAGEPPWWDPPTSAVPSVRLPFHAKGGGQPRVSHSSSLTS